MMDDDEEEGEGCYFWSWREMETVIVDGLRFHSICTKYLRIKFRSTICMRTCMHVSADDSALMHTLPYLALPYFT